MVDEEDLVDEWFCEVVSLCVFPVWFHDQHQNAGSVASQEADGSGQA